MTQGQLLKTIGMERAARFPFDEPIARARNVAILLAKRHGMVCADDVHQYLQDHLPEVLAEIPPNGWGSVLKSPKLHFTGQVKESTKVSRHCGLQRLWGYVE